MTKIVKLGYTMDTQETLRTLFHLGKKPLRVRIVCPIVKEVVLEDFSFLKTMVRLLGTGTGVTLITRNFMESKAEALQQLDILKNELRSGKIPKELYDYRLEKLTRKIEGIEESEKLFKTLKDLKAAIYCHRRIHAKIIVVESREENLALVMSSNITPSGMSRNVEVGVLLNDETCINEINKYLESIIDYGATVPYDMV